MPCYKPCDAWHSATGGITFRRSSSTGIPIQIPCGQCIGCRLDKQRDWAVRIDHEARQHPHSVFLTLTYTDENLPAHGSLSLSHCQLFLKRLRKHYAPHRYRYILNGEYGPQTLRPHYHVILFNHFSADRKLWAPSDKQGYGASYTAPTLEQIWGLGRVIEQDYCPGNGRYIASHCVKRLSAERAAPLLERVNPYTGEINSVLPEFWTMSRRPGIGAGYFSRHGAALWTHDNVIYDGRPVTVPKYYDRLRDHHDAKRMENVRYSRILKAREPQRRANNTPERLAVRETVTKARMGLKRKRNHL